jgi:hypothetical protein
MRARRVAKKFVWTKGGFPYPVRTVKIPLLDGRYGRSKIFRAKVTTTDPYDIKFRISIYVKASKQILFHEEIRNILVY